MEILHIFFYISLIYGYTSGWKHFHNGRSLGGNLGAPNNRKDNNQILTESGNFTRWFTQNLDHFNVANPEKWLQKYYVNDEYADSENNVAFLLIGGEGPTTDLWMTSGQWIEYAKQFKAILFQLEHRFYGESHPTADLSVENLKYLTSEQALADLAVFVDAMNEEYNLASNVKWIAFGGSYPGSLAAWSRLKYPHLIHGAVSSSGPLLAIPNFEDYFQVVADDLKTISTDCYKAVKVSFGQVQELTEHKVGQRTVTSLFKLCDPLDENSDNENDIASFYSSLADNFAGIAQYNKDNRKGITRNVTLDTVCSIMTNFGLGNEIQRLASFNELMLNLSNDSCVDFKYSNMINKMRNESWSASTSEGMRQWTFQTCNEFGFYQTSDKKPHIFSDKFTLQFSLQQCTDIYGEEFSGNYLDYATKRTNTMYGALDIEVNNVVFVHGSVDPWHALGITTTRDLNAPAIYINGTAHCANMYTPSETDLPQLKEARIKIGEYIEKWLN